MNEWTLLKRDNSGILHKYRTLKKIHKEPILKISSNRTCLNNMNLLKIKKIAVKEL